jgi:hypothetical protein
MQHFFFGREVVIEAARQNAGCIADFPDRGGFKTFASKQFGCNLQNLGTTVADAAAAFFGG